jgi:Rps23 Pro-64 3,4-dihydroxylase Tpa1-like proline 4-hydroxylase
MSSQASARSIFAPHRAELLALAGEHRERYAQARPFPHAVIDGVFAEDVLDAILNEFPSADREEWLQFESDNERKLASNQDASMGETTRQLLAELNSAAFIDFLEELTGISGLVPDPHLEGGGLHQIERGGHLNIHIDFNRHPRTRLDRRLNVLVYLNRDWDPAWGGALELWSSDMRRREARVDPLFNRMVVFSTTEFSYHGHPEPLACPEDRNRRSLALYYYSSGRPEEGRSAADSHNTVWAQPGEPPGPSAARERAKHIVKRITPPALIDAAKAVRSRRKGS